MGSLLMISCVVYTCSFVRVAQHGEAHMSLAAASKPGIYGISSPFCCSLCKCLLAQARNVHVHQCADDLRNGMAPIQ